MATRAAMAYRDAEIQKRLDAAVTTLADRFAVDLPPPFPPVRNAEFRALDERDWLTITLERLVDATQSERSAAKTKPAKSDQPVAEQRAR
jgi:hypothetical protein